MKIFISAWTGQFIGNLDQEFNFKILGCHFKIEAIRSNTQKGENYHTCNILFEKRSFAIFGQKSLARDSVGITLTPRDFEV